MNVVNEVKQLRKEVIARQSVKAVPYAILTETTSQSNNDNCLRHLHTVLTRSCCSLSKTLLQYEIPITVYCIYKLYSQGDTVNCLRHFLNVCTDTDNCQCHLHNVFKRRC